MSIYCYLFMIKIKVFGCVGSSSWHVEYFAAVHELSSCGTGAFSCSIACGVLVPWQGIKPESPALQGGCLITGPLGKSPSLWFWFALLMVDEAEHLLMLLVIWLSSFMKCLFKSFALFSIVSSVFFISINRNALYILHTSLPIPGPKHCPFYSMGLIAFQVGAEWPSTWVGKSTLIEWMRPLYIFVCVLAYVSSFPEM